MRFYKITCGDLTFDATNNPNALNVELDIPVAPEGGPGASGAFARVWGIPLSTILNAKQYNNQKVTVFGGMQKGLPLARPEQQGQLVQGNAFPVLGNWVGTDMTLDFYIRGPFGIQPPTKVANVVHDWPKNKPLANFLKNTLQTAYPGFTPKINISDKLVLPNHEWGIYQTLGQYATHIFNISKSIMNDPKYLGVHIFTQGKTIVADDGTTPQPAPTISPTDLIGQPIWTDTNKVQFKTVMRGDIKLLQVVTLPKSFASLTQLSGTNTNPTGAASNIIQGKFKVLDMRHTGNFRQPDWASWCTTFNCITTGG